MIIRFEIDTKLLKLLKINLSQLLFVDLIHSKTSKTRMKEFVKLKFLSDNDFQELIDLNIVTEDSVLSEVENVKLHPTFIKQYKELGDDDFFEEFLLHYPKQVTRPDGLRSFLRNSPKRAQALYKQLVGNDRERHNELIKALRFEVQDREITGTSSYMKTMINWITQEGWEYADQRESYKSEILPGYGTHFI